MNEIPLRMLLEVIRDGAGRWDTRTVDMKLGLRGAHIEQGILQDLRQVAASGWIEEDDSAPHGTGPRWHLTEAGRSLLHSLEAQAEPEQAPTWVEVVCRIAAMYRNVNASIHELFQAAKPDVADPRFVQLMVESLEREPELVRVWQQYSYDKRGTPSPYLNGTEVGFVEVLDGRVSTRAIRHFESPVVACSVFIWRETVWVLERREVSWPGNHDTDHRDDVDHPYHAVDGRRRSWFTDE